MENTEALTQRSQEWLQARVGHVTASAFKRVMGRKKDGGYLQDRKDYLMQVVSERLSGQPTSHYVTPSMQWGVEQEPAARDAYKLKTGFDVLEVGFIKHPTLMVGVSPDGIVDCDGENGLIEIKCPNTTTHCAYILGGTLPDEHKAQVQGQMWITGFQWCDFVSFDPRMPTGLQLMVLRVQRDDEFIKLLEAEVASFLTDVDNMIEQIKGRMA